MVDNGDSDAIETKGVAIGNVFMLEDWFFNGGLEVQENWGPQKFSPKVSGKQVQGGGGNMYQPVSGMVIPDASNANKQIEQDGTTYLWSAEGDLINLLSDHKSDAECIAIMKDYRENSVTELEIKQLADNGNKFIRISAGWWIFNGDTTDVDNDGYKVITDPYYNGTNGRALVRQVQGGLTWIEEKLCLWASKYNMKVILDIHACPGGSSCGVSYAGLPAVYNEDAKTYEWLDGVFFISKACQDKFMDHVIPTALDFIRTMNAKYSDLFLAFEPMNEPGLGFYNVTPPVGFDDWAEEVVDKTILGNAELIYNSYMKCIVKFTNYQKNYSNNFFNTQFWIQIYIGPGYGAIGFESWQASLDNLKSHISSLGEWPAWLAIDYHWYQTWDIPICVKECLTEADGCDSTANPDKVNCSIYSIQDGQKSEVTCASGSFTCNALCEEDEKAKQVFDAWVRRKMIGDFDIVKSWFKDHFPERLSSFNPAKPLYKLLHCTEWAVASTPPREPYQQCEQTELLEYFFCVQRQIYDDYGIINCYWTLKCPQSGNIENPWSYQWLNDNVFSTKVCT